MKKKVLVTLTKEFEIDINDEKLTPESIEEFEKYLWEVNHINDLFGYAAVQIAQYESHFIEGLGNAVGDYSNSDREVTFKELSFESEYEIL